MLYSFREISKFHMRFIKRWKKENLKPSKYHFVILLFLSGRLGLILKLNVVTSQFG